MIYDKDSFLRGLITGLKLGRSVLMGFITKLIHANGVYRASDEGAEGYSIVTVQVPNSYTAADEGKVVSSGTLIPQTARTITQNGTYDTTENKTVTVNVSGGGGYIPLEKAVFSGGQYFAITNIPANSKLKIITAVHNIDSNLKSIVGHRHGGTAADDFELYFRNSSFDYWARSAAYISPYLSPFNITVNTRYTIECTLLTARSEIFVGIYGKDLYDTVMDPFIGELCELTIYDSSNQITHHIVPAKDYIFGEVFFYDTVNMVVYRNLGTGSLSEN